MVSVSEETTESTNQARDILERLNRDLQAVEAQWEELNLKRERIKAGIVGMQQFLGIIPLNGTDNSTSEAMEEVSSLPVINKNTFKNLSVVGAGEKYLRLVGNPASHRDLVDTLLRGGLKTSSKHPADTIRTMLQRRGDTFFWDKEARVWKLVEWISSEEKSNE